jgi:hypothetical protein
MAKISLSTDEPINDGVRFKDVAAEDVQAFEAWAQERGLTLRLTNGEKLNLMDYLYYKWEQSRG